MSRPLLLAAALSIAASACASKGASESGAASSASAAPLPRLISSAPLPTLPTLSSAGAKFMAPKWLNTIAPRAVAAKAGDRIWAVVPRSGQEAASFGVVEVSSLQGATATTVGLVRAGSALAKDPDLAAERTGTPAALMSPALGPEAAGAKAGDLVIAALPGDRAVIARVVKIEGKAAEIEHVAGDKVEKESAEYAAPLGQGVAPFAYVAVKSGDALVEALCVAVVDEHAYAIDGAGNVLRVLKESATALDVKWKDRKKGDKVTVFDAAGSAEGVIEKAVTPKWLFEVKIAGASRTVPFHAVVDRP